MALDRIRHVAHEWAALSLSDLSGKPSMSLVGCLGAMTDAQPCVEESFAQSGIHLIGVKLGAIRCYGTVEL